MADKEKIIDEISAKYSKNQLRKISEKYAKLPQGVGKHEMLARLEKLKKEELEDILKGVKKTTKKKTEEKVVEISLKPNKWMIPAIAVIIFIILLSTGVFNPKAQTQTTSKALLTYIVDNSCPTCYDVTVNEEILTQQYGITLTTQTYDVNSNEAKALITKYKITKIPTFILTGESVNSNTNLISVWSSVGTVESDNALVFRSPEVISESYKILNANGTFSMYIPPEQTLSNFLIMPNSTLCTENGKPIVYFFGSTSCPHCLWEHPILTNVTALFNNTISMHDNMGTETDMSIFSNYLEYNKGGVPFMVIGCKYVRVGSGEASISDNLTITELNKTIPSIVSASLAIYNEAINYQALAIQAYQNNQTIYMDYANNYTALLKESSLEIEKYSLIKLICNVTNNQPASVCQ